jgi:hypothetical protein
MESASTGASSSAGGSGSVSAIRARRAARRRGAAQVASGPLHSAVVPLADAEASAGREPAPPTPPPTPTSPKEPSATLDEGALRELLLASTTSQPRRAVASVEYGCLLLGAGSQSRQDSLRLIDEGMRSLQSPGIKAGTPVAELRRLQRHLAGVQLSRRAAAMAVLADSAALAESAAAHRVDARAKTPVAQSRSARRSVHRTQTKSRVARVQRPSAAVDVGPDDAVAAEAVGLDDAVATRLIQAWCRGWQLRLRMTQSASVLADLSHESLGCAIRCAWSYNQAALDKADASALAAILAAEGRPSAIVVLQAASELLGGREGSLVRGVLAQETDERHDWHWVYARHLAGLTFDFSAATLICELILELAQGRPQQQRRIALDTSSTNVSESSPSSRAAPSSSHQARCEVGDQIERLESIEKIVEESARRLATVKLQVQQHRNDATSTHEQCHATGSEPSIHSLQQRSSAVDAHIAKLLQRSAMLGQRIGPNCDAGDGDSDGGRSGGVGLRLALMGQPLAPNHLENLRALLLADSRDSGGNEAQGSTGAISKGQKHGHRTAADWRRILRPFADDAGQLTWRKFREALLSLSTLSDLLTPAHRSDTALNGASAQQAAERRGSSDLALHVLFDTLDVRCSGSVFIDELHRFLCTEPPVENYLRASQDLISVEVQELRAEAAGLRAWIQHAKQQAEAQKRDASSSGLPGSHSQPRYEFELHVDQPSFYTPFASRDSSRLMSAAQRRHHWQQQVWKHVRVAICHRTLFGRQHASPRQLFASMVIESHHGGGSEGIEAVKTAEPAVIRYDDVVEVLQRLGLGLVHATIADLLSTVEANPAVNGGAIYLESLLAQLSPQHEETETALLLGAEMEPELEIEPQPQPQPQPEPEPQPQPQKAGS